MVDTTFGVKYSGFLDMEDLDVSTDGSGKEGRYLSFVFIQNLSLMG